MQTLDQLIATRAKVQAAYDAALQNQELQVGQGMGARRVVRADLATLSAELQRLDVLISRASRTRRVFNLRPR